MVAHRAETEPAGGHRSESDGSHDGSGARGRETVRNGTDAATETRPDDVGLGRLRRARWGRRLILAILVLFVVLGVVGALGPRDGSKTATQGPWSIEVQYPAIDRAGLVAPFSIEVTRVGGFDGDVTLRVADAFLAALDENGLDPEPVETTAGTANGTAYVDWTFTPPTGQETLVVSYDARVEPGQRGRVEGFVEVMPEQGTGPRVDFTTWLLP
jgi:hypothetical protein